MRQDTVKSNLSELYAEDNIAVLTIDNGPKNLLSEPEFIDRRELLDWLEMHPQTGALVITGKGRHFSQGADVSLFGTLETETLSQKLENAKELLRTIENLPLVTAAAINGGCFGGGLEIALSCQFRIASPKAILGLTEVMHGVVPGMGGMERLYRLLGREKALQMILQGEIISAQDAHSLGLVTKLSAEKDALSETLAFVKELTNGRSIAQIHAIVDTINGAARGEENPSKGKFEACLSEVQGK